MNNKETIVSQIVNGSFNFVIGKARQTGRSSSSAMKALYDWQKLHNQYKRRLNRKETIKRLFNI